MSLKEAIRTESGRKGPRCTYATMYQSLEAEDAADLDACMEDEAISSASIARGLASIGKDIKQYTVTRHRKGECNCGRAA